MHRSPSATRCVNSGPVKSKHGVLKAARGALSFIAAHRALEIFLSLTAADGYKTITADLGSDPVVSYDGIALSHAGRNVKHLRRVPP